MKKCRTVPSCGDAFAVAVQVPTSGIKPTEAYVSLGYSKAEASQSANNLLKRSDVREWVNEIQSLAAQSSAEEMGFRSEAGAA
jgi:hypothetical protein